MNHNRFLLISLCSVFTVSGLAWGATDSYRQQVDQAVRAGYNRAVTAPESAPAAAALRPRLELLDELVQVLSVSVSPNGQTKSSTTAPAPQTAGEIFAAFAPRFAVPLKADVGASGLDALRAYYSACVAAAEAQIWKSAAGLAGDRADQATACALVVRFLHVPDSRWQPDDYKSLPEWLKQPDAMTTAEQFALQVRRPLTAYSFQHPPGLRDAALMDYLIHESSKASLRQGAEVAAEYLLTAVNVAEGLRDTAAVANCRARRAEIFEALNQPARAAEELRAAMGAAKNTAAYGRMATLRLKALYAAKQDSQLLTELGDLEPDPQCVAWRPHLLYIGWAAATRQGRTSAVEGYQKEFLQSFPDHPLGADMCFSAAMTALAAGRYDDSTQFLQTLEDHYPDSKKAKQAKDVLVRLKSARAPTTAP
jgi:hypothetical protein